MEQGGGGHAHIGHTFRVYVTGFPLLGKDRAYILVLCSPFLSHEQRPGTYPGFMFPVSLAWTKTGNISKFYVPRFFRMNKDREHILGFMFPVSPSWTKTGNISWFYVPRFSRMDIDRAQI